VQSLFFIERQFSTKSRERQMEGLKDFWESLVAAARDRTTNPFTISFVLSWSLCNYRFFAVLFSEGPIDARLKTIAELYPTKWDAYLYGPFGYPFLIACTYVFLYPFFASVVIKYSRRHQVMLANALKDIEGKRLLSEDDSIALIRRHEKELKRLKDDLAEANSKSEKLSAALAVAEEERAASKPPMATLFPESMASIGPDFSPSNPSPTAHRDGATDSRGLPADLEKFSDLRSDLVDTLLDLSNRTGAVPAHFLFEDRDRNLQVVIADLDELQEMGLVENTKLGGGTAWKLSKLGSRLVVQLERAGNR
jgi:hypothetical protein